MLIRAAASVALLTAISRCAGFLRDMVIAATLGATPLADAFLIAFKLPNVARRLFAEGAFDAAFVPLVAVPLAENRRGAALAITEQALAVLFAALLVVTLLAEAAMPWLIAVLAPGFVHDPLRFDAAVALARLTFPYLLLVSLSAALAGLLNASGRFAASAAAPILLNLVLIAAGLLIGDAVAFAWAVTLGGAMQLAWLAFACREAGFRLVPRLPRLTPETRLLLRRLAPGALGAGFIQLNLLVGTMIASLLPSGAVTILYLADRVTQLPVGLVGAALATALLPMLARSVAAADHGGADSTLARALDYGLLATLPAAIGLMLLAQPIVAVLFQRGAFDDQAAQATGLVLRAYGAGVPAYVLVKILGPAFFARGDTKAPVLLACLSVLANVALSLALLGQLGALAVAAATAASAWLNAMLLALLLAQRGWLRLDSASRRRIPRALAATLIMALVLSAGQQWVGAWPPLLALATLIAAGLVSYTASLLALGAISWREIMRLRRATG